LAGLLDGIRELGMRVMLWMQQYALGKESFYYPQLSGSLSYVVDQTGHPVETPTLCPQAWSTRRHLMSLFGRVLSDYRPDAFWFDWQEDIPAVCHAAHFHDSETFGEAYNATQRSTTELILQSNPEVFIEMRWPYANLNNKPYTHLWQPIDSPDDFEVMRLRAMVMRPFSAGVVMGTDEMYWAPSVPDSEAARFMAAVIFSGVPYFGPNLLAEPKSRSEMLKAWLRFYENNREDLVRGNFAPYGNRDHPDQIIESARAAFVYYGNRYSGTLRLSQASEKVYVANASRAAGIDLRLAGLKSGNYRVEISDLYLKTAKGPLTVYLDENVRLQFDVPVGGLLILTRIS
jgi:hypothetical protein